MKTLMIGEDRVAEEISLYIQCRWSDAKIISTVEGEQGIELVEKESPDLLLVDISLRDLQYIDFITNIRSFSDIPIILLADKENGIGKARGLEAGADECFVRPFEPIDFLARVKALLRRVHGDGFISDGCSFEAGNLQINFTTHEVFHSGNRSHLTPTEYKLLQLLVRNQGRVISHEMVLDRVWGPMYDDPSYIKKYIYRLRQKLGDDSQNPRLLMSERGTGYRFVRPL